MTPKQPGTDLLSTTDKALETFRDMAFAIPEVDRDGSIFIVPVINATDVAGVLSEERESGTVGSDDLGESGAVFIIQDVHRTKSDYSGGLGMTLVCDCVYADTGEPFVMTTGATKIVAQITKLFTMDALPVQVKVKVADKATGSGNFPLQLISA
jgi:hypothetical protein